MSIDLVPPLQLVPGMGLKRLRLRGSRGQACVYSLEKYAAQTQS